MFGWISGKKTEENFHLIVDASDPISTLKGETVLKAALRSGIDFPSSCRVGGCAAYLLSEAEIRDNFILGCQNIPLTSHAIVIIMPMLRFRFRIYALMQNNPPCRADSPLPI